MKRIFAIAPLLLIPFTPLPVLAQITAAPDVANTTVNQVGNTFNITNGTQAGSNLFHSFQQFGLNAGQVANFLSNPAIQNILGRVTGGNASVINGQIQVTGSNANLYLMNPAGIVFGANARLNVPGAFTATTANGIGIGNGWFNAIGTNNYATLGGTPNQFAFTTLQPGAIINAGNLAVRQGQSITLLGGTVINTGTLTAPEGTVIIAAVPGEKLVRVSQHGSPLSLDLPTETRAVLNSTTVTPIALPALLTGGNLANATGLTVENGVVKLTGSGATIPTQVGVAVAANQIDVSGVRGGTVNILGDRVGVVGATINATGVNGGGTVLIGGDYQGQGTVPNAQQTYVSRDSVIHADALQKGNGGNVIVWADNTTRFNGNITARGGVQAGNGGFVEVSGKQNLSFDGGVDVQAPAGRAGQLLLDPATVLIGANGADNAQLDLDVRRILADTDPGATFLISVDRLVEALSRGNVAIAAATNIDVNSEINATLNTNTASLELTAPQINLNQFIQLTNGDITLNGSVRSNAPPPTGFYRYNLLRTNNGSIVINGSVDRSGANNADLILQASETIAVTGQIGSILPFGSVRLQNANTVALNNYTGINRLDVDYVQQLRLESPGDLTITDNVFLTSVERVQINAGNNLTVGVNYLEPRTNLSLNAVNTLTVENATLDTSSNTANLQLQGQTVNILGSTVRDFRDVAVQGQTITIQPTATRPTDILAQRNLTINAQNSLQVQDGGNPVLLQAGGNLSAQGNAGVSLQMLNQPQSVVRSGGSLAIVSDGTIAANARILSDSNLSFLNTSGAPGDITFTAINSPGIISSVGDVTFGNYNGLSLKVEARGSIRGGSITVTGANTTLTGSDPDIAILSSIPSVILRAGLGELQNTPNAYPNTQQLRNAPTVPPDRTIGTTSFSGTSSPSAGTITVGDLTIASGANSNFIAGKQIILAATDNVTTGNINGGTQSVAISTTGGDIKTGDISTRGFSGYNGVSLSAPSGNIEISTIDTGAAGIDITAGKTFRAIGATTVSGYDAFGSGLSNNPDLINYLVSLGFDRQQLLNAGVQLEPPRSPRPPLQISLISRPSTYPNGTPVSPITVRYGDQSQVILDRPNGVSTAERIQILGDSQQKFRMGPIPQDNLPFVPANPSDRIQDYNPLTNNFRFAFNASLPLSYPSAQFPADASGLAAGIVVGPGNNSSLYGSAQFRVFDPVSRPDAQTSTYSGVASNGIEQRRPTNTASVNVETGQFTQKDFTTQTQRDICNSSTTIASAQPEARSPASSPSPCLTRTDDQQILKILGVERQ